MKKVFLFSLFLLFTFYTNGFGALYSTSDLSDLGTNFETFDFNGFGNHRIYDSLDFGDFTIVNNAGYGSLTIMNAFRPDPNDYYFTNFGTAGNLNDWAFIFDMDLSNIGIDFGALNKPLTMDFYNDGTLIDSFTIAQKSWLLFKGYISDDPSTNFDTIVFHNCNDWISLDNIRYTPYTPAPSPVPEPASIISLSLGLGVLLLSGKRNKQC